ncbi:MAG: glycosyltransferase family 2 protein [Bacteroidia bacterium]
MDLTIIVPLYNEEQLVPQVISKLLNLKLPEFVNKREIIVVDDASSDGSYQVVEKIAARHEQIHLLRHEVNQGKGAAVHTAIAAAKGNVFLIQDADMELDPADIPAMLTAMHKLKVQLVNGSRYMPGVIRPLSSYRRFMANRLFTLLTSIFINVRITDMACGYKLIHKDLLDQIQLKEKRFGIEAELIIKAMRIRRNNIAEVPVQYFPRNEGEGKKLRTSDGIKILWIIFKYGLWDK